MSYDAVTIYMIARETSTRLDVLRDRVAEGKSLQEAKEFTAFLRWSRILKLLETHSQPEPLKVDGAHIRWKCEQVEALTHDQFRQKQVVIPLQMAQLEAINHKLDLIAGHVSKLQPPTIETASAGSPALLVIEGGFKQGKKGKRSA